MPIQVQQTDRKLDHLQLLQMRGEKPGWEVLSMLSEEDEETLCRLLQSEPNATNWLAYSYGLSKVGGDRAAGVCIQAIVECYMSGIPEEQFVLLPQLIWNLGYIASRSEVAYNFLLSAYEQSYWDGLNRSPSGRSGSDVARVLVLGAL